MYESVLLFGAIYLFKLSCSNTGLINSERTMDRNIYAPHIYYKPNFNQSFKYLPHSGSLKLTMLCTNFYDSPKKPNNSFQNYLTHCECPRNKASVDFLLCC